MVVTSAFSLLSQWVFRRETVLVVVLYSACLAFYRLYFHPLSKFPGPALAAITDYWELYQDYLREESGHLYLELDSLHKRYGRSIAAMEDSLQQYTSEFRQDLASHVGEVLDMRVYTLAWTTDFITGQIFRKRLGLFWDVARAQSWFNTVFDFSAQFPLTKHLPWLVTMGLDAPAATWKILCPPLVPYIGVYKDLLNMAKEASYKSDGRPTDSNIEEFDGNEKDIFQTILSSNLPPQEKHPKRMANEVYNLLIAGSLTSSKTTTIGLYHILAQPEVLSNLRSELKAAIPDPAVMPAVKDLQQLQYLTAVIKEVMRIACVVTTRFPMISPDEALRFGNRTIPAGASVSMTYCKAAMDPNIFRDPQTFRPERWLNGDQGPHDYERFVLPFGRGSRVCVGIHLAYAQQYLLLASLIRYFDLDLFETTREKDIDIKGGGPLGEPTRKTKGVRVRVKSTIT